MDNDDGSLVRRDTSITSDNTTRRVLGSVSPNIRNPAAAKLLLANKPMAGSPLKRSWNTMDGAGFTYFKKRKLSMDTPLSSDIFNVPRNMDNAAAYVNEHVMQQSPQDSDSNVMFTRRASSTRPNTPTEADANDADDNDSAAERRSFSSLIDYDPSSQVVPCGSQQATNLLFNGPSYAELLRLRLRVAMYKVKTNQIYTPFTELRVDERVSSESGAVPADASPQPQEQSPSLAQQRDFLKLLPGPVLRPTPYSSRMIYDSSLPSSPPVAPSPSKDAEVATPERTDRFTRPEEELTSSIVKGQGAEALLGLRNAV